MYAIHHVQVAAPFGCELQAREFYGGLLGLQEIAKLGATKSTGGLWFQAQNIEVHIGVDADFRPARKAHVAFETTLSGLHSLAQLLQSQDYHVRWDEKIPTITRFFTNDPFLIVLFAERRRLFTSRDAA